MGFPSDQLSTHVLMPAGTSELAKLGALPRILECKPSRVRWGRIVVDGIGALPGQVARLTGAPVAHASHVGPIEGETPLAPGIAWKTQMLGESQICDRDGTILARLTLEDGEGHVAAAATSA
jgi:hypothetical protein